ncbi:H-NS histone family protein [uncultured Roseobacter sp.]|uniref:H-NS histone family protein n=1 Tax=uncultured Roseobacter sp. TaxID=114847 RepID=UPI00262FFF7A|nr:H-NS histone family protein [uncultured Roseobacter sp.]
MAKVNLAKMSLDELKKLRKDVDAAIVSAENTARKTALAAAKEAVAKHGFSLEELLGAAKPSKKAPKPAKYAHPENPEQTWSGMGRQPKWIKEALEAGKSLDGFLIK